ncbi:hypothetical protein TRICI_001111 [Trichomonascus ciferrii]|uniref:L-rhamnose mutarotase n=1 Tax=Trichomonascus ciferrii TaxID=44093 RepID=A0A642VCL9_9ASCO|nr:hypothetical protein TRICI_001111 [Trichomonascus ciferrii]
MGEEKHPGKRICQIVKVRPEKLEEYIKVHGQVPEPVLSNLRKYNIEDYSIHYSPQFNLLISNMKYLGDDFERDGELMRNEPENKKWWDLTDGMQETMVEGTTGSADPKGWWTPLQEVFRFDH